MDFFERISYFIEYKGETINSFTLKLGFSSGLISKMIKNHAALGSDKLMTIFQTYPELSPNWLLTGRGEMIIEGSHNDVCEPQAEYRSMKKQGPCPLCEEKDHLLDRANRQLDRYEKEIDRLQRQLDQESADKSKRNSA